MQCNPPYTRSKSPKGNANTKCRLSILLDILLESTQELVLLGGSLVGTVAELGGGIDPFEVYLLQSLSRGVDKHRLAESHDTLLDTWNGALEDDEVVLDLTISDEATHTDIISLELDN